MELFKNKVFRIEGKLQHYAWGGFSYLPKLLHLPEKPGLHYAEYWMGAHEQASAAMLTANQEKILIKDYINAFPEQTLGKMQAQQFGRLPYLLKVLDVQDMLSIQVHPSREQAIIEFAAENARGVPRDAAYRNYKDDNHKPELMLALAAFWLLHGFKAAASLRTVLETVPELNFLSVVFGNDNYQALYRAVMEMPQEEVNSRLNPLLERILPLYENGRLDKSMEDFWAARAALTYNQPGKTDRGIFSIYFFNLVRVEAGQALFQDAGLPHAYLEGQNVEIMANSDNVLRGGLTAKHIDVKELMKHIRFQETIPHLMSGRTEGPVTRFITSAPDFELSSIHLKKGEGLSMVSPSAEIFIIMEGLAELTENGENAFIRKTGESWICFAAANTRIEGLEGSVIYRAGIPKMGL